MFVNKDKLKKFKQSAIKTGKSITASLDKTEAVGSKLASGLGGIRPRVRGDNLSRQVLEDSYRLDTRNMYR